MILQGADGRQLVLLPIDGNNSDCCDLSLIDSGSFSQLDMPLMTELPTQQVFEDEETFTSFINAFVSVLNLQRILSEIDFNQDMAIVLIGELRGVPSYFVEIAEYEERQLDIRLIARTVELTCETFVAVFAANYKIYRAPKSTKPLTTGNTLLFTDEFCF